MKSYEKLKAKVDILENLLSDIESYLSDMINKPENVIPADGELTLAVRYALSGISRDISHEIYLANRKIWNLK